MGSLFSHKSTFALCGQRALGSVVLGSNSPTSKLVWFTAQKVLEDLIAGDERFLTTPEPIVRVKQFSDSSIDFLVRAYVKTEEFWETLWALNKAVKQRFDAEGITIPFPQRDVHMAPQTESTPAQ